MQQKINLMFCIDKSACIYKNSIFIICLLENNEKLIKVNYGKRQTCIFQSINLENSRWRNIAAEQEIPVFFLVTLIFQKRNWRVIVF